LIFSGCKKPLQKSEEQLIQVRDWDEIKSSGKLIALVDNSTTSYFIYRGQPLGFEYELLNWFAQENNLELEIVLINDLDSVFQKLNNGFGDIIAANLTITKPRQELVNFTEPHLSTRQVLVQKLPENY
jgi:membrane-bound lytic murein transglycosylase F